MIGIFDSGVGGFNAYYEVRKALLHSDIAYLADRKHAPYGTKEKDELVRLVKNDVKRLRELGCSAILIACCTASTVYFELDEEERKISIPIITPAAKKAADGASIAVIATDATVRSHSFREEISRYSAEASITEIPAQALVGMIERGARCKNLSPSDEKTLCNVCEEIKAHSPDTLVLGCTHFSHLEEEFRHRLTGVRIISPAREGAQELIRRYKEKNLHLPHESGKTVYL